MKKRIALVAVLVVVSLFGWLIWRRAAEEKAAGGRGPRGPAAVPVEVTEVRRATIRDISSLTGSLVPRSYYVVAPKIGGRLEKLLVNLGDVVKQGQLLALLDDEEYNQQVEQARAELEVAKATVQEAKSGLDSETREYERVQTLRGKSIASESELDAAKARYEVQESRYKVALAQVDQKEASLKAAQVRLSYTRIQAAWEARPSRRSSPEASEPSRAPASPMRAGSQDGSPGNGDDERVVGERFVDEGAMLRANDPIVSIVDLGSLTAVVHVIERDYSKIRVGQEATVTTDAYPGQVFAGRIVRVAPLLKETSREARVEVEIPNPEGLLKPGMFVRAQIEFDRHDNATVVPTNALARREDRQGVFLADLTEKKAHFVPVTVGIVSGDEAEITAPPLTGMVVTLGQHLLTDGSAIIVGGAAGAPPAGGGEAGAKAGPPAEASPGRASGR